MALPGLDTADCPHMNRANRNLRYINEFPHGTRCPLVWDHCSVKGRLVVDGGTAEPRSAPECGVDVVTVPMTPHSPDGQEVDSVISLIIASLYLGLATGVGFTATIMAIATGFGEIMGEVGLLIGFGVLIGAMLHVMGDFRKMVAMLVNGVGARRLPFALTAMSTIFPSIYVDVQVVLASPVARSSGPFIGRTGLPYRAGAFGTGSSPATSLGSRDWPRSPSRAC